MRHFVPIMVLLVTTSLLAADESGSSPKNTSIVSARKDKAAMAGIWNVVSLEVAGRKVTNDVKAKTKSLRVLISDDALTVFSGAKLLSSGTYALDPSKKPAAIDLWTNDNLTLGIYQLDSDTLKMRLCESGPDRPKTVSLKGNGSNDVLLTLARAKDEGELKKLEKLVAESKSEEEPKEADVDMGRPLFVINVDGSGMRKLLCRPGFTWNGSPDWSRDGKKIAMDTDLPSNGPKRNQTHIGTINADGSDPKHLGPGAMPSWSPDGTRIAFCQYAPFSGVWIMNADGSGRERIAQGAWGIEWSPTREEVAYNADGNICVFDLTKRTRRMLLKNPQGRPWRGMGWSADGKQICFRMDMPGGTMVIAVVSAEGEENDMKVLYEGEVNEVVSWAGRGQPIVISKPTGPNGVRHLHLLDPDGQKPPRPVPGQDPNRENTNVSWSPDGKQIVFRSYKVNP